MLSRLLVGILLGIIAGCASPSDVTQSEILNEDLGSPMKFRDIAGMPTLELSAVRLSTVEHYSDDNFEHHKFTVSTYGDNYIFYATRSLKHAPSITYSVGAVFLEKISTESAPYTSRGVHLGCGKKDILRAYGSPTKQDTIATDFFTDFFMFYEAPSSKIIFDLRDNKLHEVLLHYVKDSSIKPGS